MIGFFHSLFFHNWQRKGLSVLLAIVIWLIVNHSLTTTKTISNVSVRVINVPQGKTVEGLQSSGILNERLTLVLVGNETILKNVTFNDIEVIIDASNKPEEWTTLISKKNLLSLNPEVDIAKGINRIVHQTLTLRTTKLVTETIPVVITQPIGEPPRGYQYLDVWPYSLNVTVSGPAETIKKLKSKKLKLTFNLNEINKQQLDFLETESQEKKGDVISYFVPDAWKQILIPSISSLPIDITDLHAKALRIDFVRYNLLSLDYPLPVTLFFPQESSAMLNPTNCTLAETGMLKKVSGLYLITEPLFVKGVSESFLQIVKNRIALVVTVAFEHGRPFLKWSVQFINPHELEDHYVSLILSNSSDLQELQPKLREEYLRNRFRSYMHHFRLYTSEEAKLKLDIHLEDQTVAVHKHA